MESKIPANVRDRIEKCGVVAVLVIDDAKHAVPLAKALLAGGVDVMELTLRTPAAIGALKEVVQHVPEMLAGIGTILTTEQVDEVVAAGAAFGVAPGLNPRVVKYAEEKGLPFAPGILTPSDVELALELGCREMKFFPAEPSGGLKYLSSIKAPYAHLGVKFIPLGGLNIENMGSYIADSSVAAIGGSWLAPAKLINAEDWEAITANAAAARKVIDEVRAAK
ncbi:bifunctional 4-hydroxy-2-oxoglutarate aldolase/2-dehydro-3-deoxy-phosphogluconate aldolase [Luteolibacter algae]|uniref:2-dehydro-3-deoxy-phosphogluconate aldolase n=1 Tax=Luteolibacter algae TaxID=454151 RepID=A0ABW5DCD9_9BACT